MPERICSICHRNLSPEIIRQNPKTTTCPNHGVHDKTPLLERPNFEAVPLSSFSVKALLTSK